MVKSIYKEDDLRANEVGLDVSYEARDFFKKILEKYPDYNPREMAEMCSAEFYLMASRRVLEQRKAGLLGRE